MSYQNGGYGGGGSYGGGYGGGGGGGYGGGGRGRRNDRGRGGHRGGGGPARTLPESTAVRMRKMVVKFADDEDFDAVQDPPRLAAVLKRGWRDGAQGVLDGFRYGVMEEPAKHHHYVALLVHLSARAPAPAAAPAEGTEGEAAPPPAEGEAPEHGREVLDELAGALRSALDKREWLSARLLVQFLSLLVPAGLVTPASILEVYRGLLTVLNEVGGGGDRSERAVRAVAEGLVRSAGALVPDYVSDVEEIIGSIESLINARKSDRSIVNPLAPILSAGEEPEPYADSLSHLLAMLHELRASDYAAPAVLPRTFQQAIESFPEGTTLAEPEALTAVNMPPEMYDPDEENAQDCDGHTSGLRLFADDVILPTSTVAGWTLRSLVLDTITIYEVNRKEAARLLLAFPRYISQGTFKSEGSESTLSSESLVINTLLATMLMLPHSPQKLIYYGSVITEMCKLSPNTVAPPVGRAVRKFFSLLGEDGLDIEVARRTAEWFSSHLSNFGFQWMWKEWIPDLELPAAHPKRAFMRHLIELEVRLAYHDRILQTLPEPMLAKDAAVVAEDAPDFVWEYESASHALHAEAAELLRMMRQKASAGEVLDFLERVPGARDGAAASGAVAAPVLMMAVETIQHLGSRSFSHFLNATERYLDVLRHLSPDAASRRVLLDAIASFWRRSSQMRLLTIDKYLQYGILEALDVVEWLFADDGVSSSADDTRPDGWTDYDSWDLLRMTLDKVVGRVVAVRRRLRAVDRADEAARARRAAERLGRGDIDIDNVNDDEDADAAEPERSRESREVQASLDVQVQRLERVFVAVAQRFVAQLLPGTQAAAPAEDAEEGEEAEAPEGGLGLKGVLALQDAGETGAWALRARYGWYREFVRRYAEHLAPLAERAASQVFAHHVPEGEGPDARAENMVRGVWTEALARD